MTAYGMHSFTNETVIKIARDPDPERKATVKGTMAKGSSFASLGSGLTIGKIADKCIPPENYEVIGETTVPPCVYIDDELLRTSINMTVLNRMDNAWGKASATQNIVSHPAVNQFGYLRAAVTLLKSIIPPVLSDRSETCSQICI